MGEGRKGAAMVSTPRSGSSRRINGEDIAKKMGVSEHRVRLSEQRSLEGARTGALPRPGRIRRANRAVRARPEAQIDAYIAARSQRTGTAGRPPRTARHGSETDAPFASRLRQAVAGAGEPDVSTLRELAVRLSLNPVTLGERLRGRTSWEAEELASIERCSRSPPLMRATTFSAGVRSAARHGAPAAATASPLPDPPAGVRRATGRDWLHQMVWVWRSLLWERVFTTRTTAGRRTVSVILLLSGVALVVIGLRYGRSFSSWLRRAC